MTPIDPDGTVDMPSAAPARKVIAATGGAAAGAVTSQLIVWGLDEYVFDPDVADSVPGPVAAFVLFAVPALLAFAAGYLAKRKATELDTPAG